MISTARNSRVTLFPLGALRLVAPLFICTGAVFAAQEEIRTHLGELSGDRFGAQVAGIGDVTSDGHQDYAISSLAGSGMVKIYDGQHGDLLDTLFGTDQGDEFGKAICSLGKDINGDGKDDFVVSAWMAGTQASPDAGKLYVYSGDGTLLGSPDLLMGDDAGDRFGASVVCLGDVNGDDNVDIAVGAIDDDDRGSSSGSVRFLSIGYDADEDELTVERWADLSGDAPGDRFGSSLASADLAGNVGSALVIGSPEADGDPILANRGVVHVYEHSGGNWDLLTSQQGVDAGDHFGCSVAGLNGWGASAEVVFAVGADHSDENGSASGSVRVFSLAAGSELLHVAGDTAGDNLGEAIANAGDVNKDGHDDLIIGVPGYDSVGVNAGLARIYSGEDGAELLEVTPSALQGAPPGQYFSRFGSSVVGLGRVDFDGPPHQGYYSDTAVGTDGGASGATGQVVLFTEHMNQPPALLDDLFTTHEDSAPVAIAPLWNDNDDDGVIFPATMAIVQGPQNGVAVVDGVSGEVTYTPALNFFGFDTFTYEVADDDGALGSPATVTMEVTTVNDAPVGVADAVVTDEDVPVMAFVTENDTDVDGGPVFSTINIISWPAHGTAEIDYDAEGVFYSPAPDWFGIDSFEYTVQDEFGDSTEVTTCVITVNDVNDPPIAMDDAAIGFQEFPLAVDVLANDYDIDGTIGAAEIVITAHPAGGTVSVDVAGGVVVYLGDLGFVGTDSFSYTVADDDGDASNEVVAIITVLEDCNGNQVWDTDDIATGFSPDCNATGIPDECELVGNDCDTNGVPDECDPDCNANWRPDACEVNNDCNSNGVFDDCEVDCNQNGLPDDCDLLNAVSRDCDMDGLPDECDDIRWVDVAAADCNGDGSWATPHCTLQQAIYASSPGDVIMALPGTYQETIDFAGRNVTLKSAAGMGMTFIDGEGSGPVVRFQAFESPSCLLQGFTVTGGTASGGQAGGIAISGASPTVRGCRIQGNTSSDFGAGASTRNNAHPRFYDCVFVRNDAGRNGGGMLVDNGTVQLYRCDFIENSADDSGGGLFARNGANGVVSSCVFTGNSALNEDGGGAFLDGVGLDLDACVFRENFAGALGGGIALRNASGTPELEGCTVVDNVAGEHGGGLSFDAVNVVLRHSLIRGNEALERGGGLYVVNATQIALEGNEHSSNTCGTLGGGMFLSAQGGSIKRCTSAENVAGVGGGGAYLVEHSTPALDSCIFWGDSPDEVRVEITPTINGGVVAGVIYPDAVRYSCLQGGWPVGDGNIASDPMFRDSASGDFGLGMGSPCIDTGNPGIATDSDGSRADMGAHAYQGADYVDVLTWDFGGGEGLDPLFAAQNPMDLTIAASNLWSDHRDRGYAERLNRLADIIAEEDPDVVCLQGLLRAHVSFVGDVLSGAATTPTSLVLDQAAALREMLNLRGWSHHLAGEHVEFDLEVPVVTCGGYADVRLRGDMLTLTKEAPGAHSSANFTLQTGGPLGGLGPASPSLGWLEVEVGGLGGPRVVQTRLDSSPAAGLQAAQAAEVALSAGPGVLVGDFSSIPGSPAYNVFAGLTYEDAWTSLGSGDGATCCQAEDLMNTTSSLSERMDWALSNDVLWAARAARVIGERTADRSVSGRWTSTHAGLMSRWGTP